MGARFAASMWIHTKAVVCNGQRNVQAFTVNKMNSIIEAVNLVCVDILQDHERVSEFSLSLQEPKVLEAWDPAREMKGWELGGLDLLPENENNELVDDNEPEDL